MLLPDVPEPGCDRTETREYFEQKLDEKKNIQEVAGTHILWHVFVSV